MKQTGGVNYEIIHDIGVFATSYVIKATMANATENSFTDEVKQTVGVIRGLQHGTKYIFSFKPMKGELETGTAYIKVERTCKLLL